MSLTSFENVPEVGNLSDRLKAMIPTFLKSIEKYTPDKPVLSSIIEEGLHISGAEVRSIVSALSCAGVPIGSSGKGYYYCKTPVELDSTIKHLQERASKLARRIAGLQNAFRAGQ